VHDASRAVVAAGLAALPDGLQHGCIHPEERHRYCLKQRVACSQMRCLMRDDSLKLVPVQARKEPLGDTDDAALPEIGYREGVHRHRRKHHRLKALSSCGHAYFLHDVPKYPVVGVLLVWRLCLKCMQEPVCHAEDGVEPMQQGNE